MAMLYLYMVGPFESVEVIVFILSEGKSIRIGYPSVLLRICYTKSVLSINCMCIK